MPVEFDVHISEKLLRKLTLRHLLRRWPRILLAVVLLGASIALDSRSEQWSVVSIMGCTALALLVVIFGVVYVKQMRAIAVWKSKQGDAPLHYSLDEAVVCGRSHLGATELKWTTFLELVETQDCLLLCISSTNYLTLPLHDLPAEAAELIRRKFREMNLPIKRE